MSATNTQTKVIELSEVSARELLEKIKAKVEEVYNKLRWIYLEWQNEDNKILVWRKGEIIAELENNFTEYDINNSAIDEVYNAILEILKKYSIEIDGDYYNDDATSIKNYNTYGRWIWYYIDLRLKNVKCNEDLDVEVENIRIYYDDYDESVHLTCKLLVSVYNKDSEGEYLTTEDFIKNLGLDPNLFENF